MSAGQYRGTRVESQVGHPERGGGGRAPPTVAFFLARHLRQLPRDYLCHELETDLPSGVCFERVASGDGPLSAC